MTCPKCEGKYWLLYQKPAPSPPYKEGTFLDYGVRCDACYEPRGPGKDTRD
jgi:hypothetical protein